MNDTVNININGNANGTQRNNREDVKGGEEDKEGRGKGKQLRKGNMCHTWHGATLRHGDQKYRLIYG